MKDIIKVAKYFLRDSRQAVMIFYAITIFLVLFLFYMSNGLNGQPGTEASFGGLGFGVMIFLFVSGLNSFKTNFKFMLANSVSRRDIYFGGILAFVILAGFMAIMDMVMSQFFMATSSYQSFYGQIYGEEKRLIAEFLWNFAVFLFAVSSGWMITMLYYKSGKLMKIFISFIPVIIIFTVIGFNNATDGKVVNAMWDFFVRVFGFTDNYSSYNAVLTFILTAVTAFGLSYVLVRKMRLKE